MISSRSAASPEWTLLRFGNPGWRLGYGRHAVNSYFASKTLKQQGVVPAHVRLQVCMPLTSSAATSFFLDPADLARIVPGFTATLRTETANLARLSQYGGPSPMG